jgi:hypothetical protein
LIEHTAKRQTIDDSGLNPKSDDTARVLIHNHQHPVRPQDHGFTSKEIHTPKAVFRMAQEREPGRTIAIRRRSVMKRKNPTNNILDHSNAEGQGDLLGNTKTSPLSDSAASYRQQRESHPGLVLLAQV